MSILPPIVDPLVSLLKRASAGGLAVLLAVPPTGVGLRSLRHRSLARDALLVVPRESPRKAARVRVMLLHGRWRLHKLTPSFREWLAAC